MEKGLILHLLILIPIAGYFLSILVPRKQERLINIISLLTIGSHFLLLVILSYAWYRDGFEPIDQRDMVLYRATDYEFYLDFLFDKVSLIYLLVGALLTFLVTVYSRFYLHREH